MDYFKKHPDHAVSQCDEQMRKKFPHGLRKTKLYAIKRDVSGEPLRRVKGKVKVEKGPHIEVLDGKVKDPSVAFRSALTDFRQKIKAIGGITLKSLSITLDANSGRWDIEYDLAACERQVDL